MCPLYSFCNLSLLKHCSLSLPPIILTVLLTVKLHGRNKQPLFRNHCFPQHIEASLHGTIFQKRVASKVFCPPTYINIAAKYCMPHLVSAICGYKRINPQSPTHAYSQYILFIKDPCISANKFKT